MKKFFFILVTCLLIFPLNVQAKKKPRIVWEPVKIEQTVGLGGTVDLSVTFTSTMSLNNVDLWVVPELQPFISVEPNYFETITANVPIGVTVHISVPFGTQNRIYDGTIHLRGDSKTYPQTLKIELNIVDLMEGVVPPPDTVPETTLMEYITEDGTSINIDVITGWVVVKFNLTTNEDPAENLILNNGGNIIAKIPSIRLYLTEVTQDNVMNFINIMRQEPSVNYAIPNIPLESFQIEPPNEWENKSHAFSWHLKEINADLGWALVENLTLSEIEIAIFDGDFYGLEYSPGFQNDGMIDFEGRIVSDVPFQLPKVIPEDGHGTIVTAIAAAKGNNGFGNVGVNWESKIILKKVILPFDLYLAIPTAVGDGSDVINISMGYDNCTLMRYLYLPILFDIVNDIFTFNNKFLVVNAAGNASCELTPTPITPNKPDNLILVGATTSDGSRFHISNFGNLIDIAAPGHFQILHYSSGELVTEGGTSYAAPLVTGAATLVWAKEPLLTPQKIIERLKNTANGSIPEFGGAGVLDVYKALGGIPIPTNLSATAISSIQIDLSWEEPPYDEVYGIPCYKIYRDGTYLNSTCGNTFSDINLNPSTEYCYTVSTVDESGEESVQSEQVCETTLSIPQIATTWAKTYGGSGDEGANSIQQTSDGGYIVAGYTGSFGDNQGDAWILKLNSDGTVAWEKTYGGDSHDYANSIQQTVDGGYIVAGQTMSFGAGSYNFWVLKLNSDGSVAWQKTYGGNYDIPYSIQQTSDGGYIIGGYTSFGAGSGDFWILKLNSDGTVAWQKSYGGVRIDLAYSIQQTSDGGYIIGGYTLSYGVGNRDFWILKLNTDGTIAWQKTYGGTDLDIASFIRQTSDGGYIVVGRTGSFGGGLPFLWILKLNSDGSVIWQKIYYGGAYFPVSIQQTSDEGYILGGSIFGQDLVGATYDFWVLKLDSDGSVAWQKSYDLARYDIATSIQQTSGGGYIIAGRTSDDVWILKLDSEGNINDPDCTIIETRNTYVQDTSITPSSTSAIVSDTNATITDTTVIPVDTNASIETQCYSDTP